MTQAQVSETRTGPGTEVDAVVVGAGFSGLYMLRRLRDLGLSARAFEAGSDVGGTWYWNRYPGARSDSDSHVYCFSDRFDEKMLAEWEWTERYPAQPEILRYLQWVSEKQDLRGNITFQARVTAARYDEARNRWDITTDGGETVSACYFIPAVGLLSKPNIPKFPGLDRFEGQWFHTAQTPREGVDVQGKRVAVIGNGATAVQVVPVIAQQAEHVYAFTRNPYHSLPARNHRLDAEDWSEIHAHHKEIWAKARDNFGGFPYADFKGMGSDFTDDERQQIFEEGWRKGGFPLAFSTFADVLANRDTNDQFMDFLRSKISTLVRDPQVAEQLTPSDPFCTKRPPLEHGYYSAFNRGNISLVNMKNSPIAEITPTGIRTADAEYEVDVIILATGFDAFTGSMLDLDIQGRGGLGLREKWADGPRDYLALMVHGFPNMFMLYCGPFNPAILTNAPTLIEQQGEWVAACLQHMREQGYDYIEPRQDAEDAFVQLHQDTANATLIPETESWWTGTNIEGKPRMLLSWCGGFPAYRQLCDDAAERYDGFELHAS
ncbi:NAD(P)/FAD-dependent oxidoreductase [Pseudonocardia yuanmonensis]|uniref:NAD(P)/FAD-dependent oxidoreductase n=1 Tax=Pseudonocardia yuanmonensis TaxID=1095914 RepID=A0ABP8XBI1_9PSEU